MGASDISGNPLPPDQSAASTVARVIAVPPVREFPNEQSTEFLWTGYLLVPAGTTDFTSLIDPQTGNPFSQLISQVYRARVDSLLMWCPDMVAATDPYLFTSMRIKNITAAAWGFVPIYPRDGVASLSYDVEIDLGPNSTVQLFAKNTDTADHFLAYEMHGWYWAKGLIQG